MQAFLEKVCGCASASLLFSLPLNEKRNLFIFVIIFPQSDCVATGRT